MPRTEVPPHKVKTGAGRGLVPQEPRPPESVLTKADATRDEPAASAADGAERLLPRSRPPQAPAHESSRSCAHGKGCSASSLRGEAKEWHSRAGRTREREAARAGHARGGAPGRTSKNRWLSAARAGILRLGSYTSICCGGGERGSGGIEEGVRSRERWQSGRARGLRRAAHREEVDAILVERRADLRPLLRSGAGGWFRKVSPEERRARCPCSPPERAEAPPARLRAPAREGALVVLQLRNPRPRLLGGSPQHPGRGWEGSNGAFSASGGATAAGSAEGHRRATCAEHGGRRG